MRSGRCCRGCTRRSEPCAVLTRSGRSSLRTSARPRGSRHGRSFRETLRPVDSVDIGSAGSRLRLSPEPDDPTFDHLVADLADDGLSATKRVYVHYASGWGDLAAFFAGLATDWRGWSGTREWISLESDLKIEARHEHGHVQLNVTLSQDRADWGNHGWHASADLTLEPGEQLSRVADELRGPVDRVLERRRSDRSSADPVDLLRRRSKRTALLIRLSVRSNRCTMTVGPDTDTP